MIAKNLEHPIPASLDAGVFELFAQQPVDLPTTKPRLPLSLPPDKRNDQTLIDFSSFSPSPLFVVILAGHAHLAAQLVDAYSASPLGLFTGPVDAWPTCFFLKASASVPVLSHRISKKD